MGRSPGTALTPHANHVPSGPRARGHGGTCAQHTRPHHPCHTDTTSLTALLYCHTQTGPGEVVTGQRWCSKTPVRVCFSRSVCRLSRRASASLRIVLSGCDRELKHGFTFPLFLFRCRGSARYLHHAIMQSCNHVIRRISLSLAAHRRGATKPIPGGRSSCVSPRRSFVSMKLMPMPPVPSYSRLPAGI